MSKKADMIIDLQFGSTGKGLIAGFLAQHSNVDYDVVVNANMPNAGHTYIDKKGQKMMHKVLPNGVVSPFLKYVLIGPGAVFSIDRLANEIVQAQLLGYMESVPVLIHPNAVILTDDHKNGESHLSSIGSTMQGSAAAMIHKINRNRFDNPTAGANKHLVTPFNNDKSVIIRVTTHDEYRKILNEAKNILMEGAQGYSLGINQMFYPYCTSRECTPTRFLSDMGVPIGFLRDVIGVARVHPIRVGGNSGPCYDDQTETTWEELGQKKEFTTVTNRERRVFTFSEKQIADAIWECQPTKIFLNFCNYDPETAKYIQKTIDKYTPKDYFGVKLVAWTGWGATANDIRDEWND